MFSLKLLNLVHVRTSLFLSLHYTLVSKLYLFFLLL